MKLLHLFLALLFFLFAAVQYNDPDPLGWMLLYGYVAGVCAFAAFGHRNRLVLLAGIGVVMIWIISLTPAFIAWLRMGMPTIAGSMKAEAPHIELMREFSGLFLCLVILVFQYVQGRKTAFGQHL
ncbi:MAG: transmembrane 220 family protein [Saprospiraceae bacterium]|nr:transmembrane 220 family protein [Saprospiraceae bacterium]